MIGVHVMVSTDSGLFVEAWIFCVAHRLGWRIHTHALLHHAGVLGYVSCQPRGDPRIVRGPRAEGGRLRAHGVCDMACELRTIESLHKAAAQLAWVYVSQSDIRRHLSI
jgi:hypothetical protein